MTLRYSITPVIHCQTVTITTSELVVRARRGGQQNGVSGEVGTNLSKMKTLVSVYLAF